jgi:hypothetical protein
MIDFEKAAKAAVMGEAYVTDLGGIIDLDKTPGFRDWITARVAKALRQLAADVLEEAARHLQSTPKTINESNDLRKLYGSFPPEGRVQSADWLRARATAIKDGKPHD